MKRTIALITSFSFAALLAVPAQADAFFLGWFDWDDEDSQSTDVSIENDAEISNFVGSWANTGNNSVAGGNGSKGGNGGNGGDSEEDGDAGDAGNGGNGGHGGLGGEIITGDAFAGSYVSNIANSSDIDIESDCDCDGASETSVGVSNSAGIFNGVYSGASTGSNSASGGNGAAGGNGGNGGSTGGFNFWWWSLGSGSGGNGGDAGEGGNGGTGGGIASGNAGSESVVGTTVNTTFLSITRN